MEKATEKNQKSCVCLLASLYVCFWVLWVQSYLKGRINDIGESLRLEPHDPVNPPTETPVFVNNALSTKPPQKNTQKNTTKNEENFPSEISPSPSSTSNIRENFTDFPFMRALKTAENKSDPCGGRYIYIHDLPSRFNEGILKDCASMSLWTDMCKFVSNFGMGPRMDNVDGLFSDSGWYATKQYALDVIFNYRMKQYDCLTNDSSIAAAIFVPFYAGSDVSRYLWGHNVSNRDAASTDLVNWLVKRPEWGIMQGRDHFLVAGRTTWDFRRKNDQESEWGNNFLFLPAAKNMSTLVVESSPWHANDFAVPFPTYFHPEKDSDVLDWQDRMRKLDRKWLFCFAGAPRPDNPRSIRGHLIDQCRQSKVCRLLECGSGQSNCHTPSNVMRVFQSSLFCLEPSGDSFTRRSTFDAMLSGCIPVFFHPGTAYVQYTWHLPKNYTTYSVFIPEDDIRRNVSIEERLSRIPPDQVRMMQESVVSLIPSFLYADPRAKLETLRDAFDVTVQAVIDRVTRMRRNIVEGRSEYDHFDESKNWKYALLDEGQREVRDHEWDSFFY